MEDPMFNFNQYQEHVLGYAKPMHFNADLLHAGLGLTSEAGEICDAFKASMVYGKDIDVVNLLAECGDGMWFAALLSRLLKFDFHQLVMSVNEVQIVTNPERLVGYAFRLNLAAARISERLVDFTDDGYPLQLPLVKQDLARYIGFLRRIGDCFGWDLERAAKANIIKLDTRYGSAGFSAERALDRDVEAEMFAVARDSSVARDASA
jgi:NTP pyrophosphatase (non-canonical NTP hydrolase)